MDMVKTGKGRLGFGRWIDGIKILNCLKAFTPGVTLSPSSQIVSAWRSQTEFYPEDQLEHKKS